MSYRIAPLSDQDEVAISIIIVELHEFIAAKASGERLRMALRGFLVRARMENQS